MSLVQAKERFDSGLISRKEYIDELYELHLRLFEYMAFIRNTDINSLQIQVDCLMLNLKNGIKLHYPLPDKRSAPFEILSFTSYEKKEILMIKNLLEPQMNFFDIGANVGWHSTNIAKQNEKINVYAFESIADIFNLLEKNISINNIDNINLYNLGFSNENKYLNFYFDKNASAYTSLRNNLKSDYAKNIISRVMRLDDFLIENKLEQLDFIKCDVEGAELLVFEGAIDSIKKYKPIIFAEMVRKFTRNFNYHPNEIIQLFSHLGYQCFQISNEKLLEFPFMDEDCLASNYLFLHQENHLEKIKQWTA